MNSMSISFSRHNGPVRSALASTALKAVLLSVGGLACVAPQWSSAAALSNTTILGITRGVGSGANLACPSGGSCFGMEVNPGFVIWTDFGPGADCGIVVGKSQLSGGQELAPSATNPSAGQLSTAWLFFGNYGTFYTSPGGDTQNVFDNAACAGAACIGKTDLKVFHVAWNGNIIPMGSSAGCTLPACTNDQKAGIFVSNYAISPVADGAWSMNYSQVVPLVPASGFGGVKFSAIFRGLHQPSACVAVAPPPIVTTETQTATGGCSLSEGASVSLSERFDWLLVMTFIAWLGAISRRHRRQPVRI